MRTYLPEDAGLIPEYAKRVFQGVLFDTYHWQQELYDGSVATFEMLKRPDTVEVLAIHDGKLVVQEQEQPHKGFFYDFPCGAHDVESETELEGAQRELLEETGMRFQHWKLVHVTQPNSRIEWFIYTFVATGFLGQVEQQLDAGEKIHVTLKSLEEIKTLQQGPQGRYLRAGVLRTIQSIEELERLPALQ